jgi:PAS domain S-box-containing protein
LHWHRSTISEPGLDDRGGVFSAAIEMTRMPMVLTDPNKPDNPIAFANRAFQDLTGYTEEEIVGRNCRFLQGARTSPEHVEELRRAVNEKRAVSVEILNYKRDGSPFGNAVYIAPVFGPGDELLYFFASQLDITRRRSSEQAFRQAQKMESIGQLTAGLAHDFNNLLHVVAGNLELLKGRLTDEGLRRYADNAALAADRGAKLTKQLLAFARKTMLDPKPTNLNDLVVEFGDMLESTAGGQVDLQFNLKRRVPPCLVDRVHLEMALLNVLINARDAMPKGGAVTLGTSSMRLVDGDARQHSLPPGEYAVLSVSDEGEGMPAHVLERATEPFFTTKPQGTGLGLAMVQGFVQQSLGRLEVESELGRGTTIRMIFPVAADGAAPAQKSAALAAPPREDPRGSAETILVVEDNDDVLALAREHLNGLGYRVLACFMRAG